MLMENFGGSGFSVVAHGIRKKRTDASRRPRLDSHTLLQNNHFPPASAELFGNGSHDKDRNNGDKIVASDEGRSENKLKKLKLKVGGVTRTINSKSTTDFANGGGSSTRVSYRSSTAFTPQEKPLLQDDINANQSFSLDKKKGFRVKWKNMSNIDSCSQKEHSSRGIPMNYEPVRKSNRVPKRRVLDVGFNEDDDGEDEEIRYLERLKAPKNEANKGPESQAPVDGLSDNAFGNYGSPRLEKEFRKMSRSEKEFEDIDYVEEEEPIMSDEEPASRGKKLKKGSPMHAEGWKESTPTTRTRASAGSIDLLNGFSSSSSKRKKEKLSEVDQQLKKAEAAQRRRMQSEKAAREAEAEAIRKILGQDSARKKREEKMKKQRDELLQRKAVNSLTLASNTVRWVDSPTGTVVTFSEDIGLPRIFNPVPCSYPPPREKCAGPNCTNAYKYRDSKSKLPLCSLQCYKAINKNTRPLVTF